MPWEKLFELTGIAPVIIVILVAFWKGDEAISAEFKLDIGGWLKRERRISRVRSIGIIMNGAFDRIFGENPKSFAFFGRAMLTSIVILIVLFIPHETINTVRGQSLTEGASDVHLIIIWLILTNIISDYISLLETRYMMRKMKSLHSNLTLIITLDILFSLAIFFVIYYLCYIGVVTYMLSSRLIEPFSLAELISALNPAQLMNETLFNIANGRDKYYFMGFEISSGQAILFLPLVTNFFTSLWLWALAIGTFSIRILWLLKSIMAFAKYALPIDDKPIRSIGIAGSVMIGILYIGALTISSEKDMFLSIESVQESEF